jgi:hypothetical protein
LDERVHTKLDVGVPQPVFRRLRVFALNPGLGTRVDNVISNQTSLSVPWENLEPGPVGEYVEVIDFDAPSRYFYRPVDLNEPLVLVQEGLPASEANPQFHQQMVYAVVMTTITNFERALGRRALWAPHTVPDEDGPVPDSQPVLKLRVYPHALREANAYYSPDKKALLFGYFPTGTLDRANLPGGMIFTCLSPEVITQTTVHALLDGARRHFVHSTGPDSSAFTLAFADLVALFQTLVQRDLVRERMKQPAGDFSGIAPLGLLAQMSWNPPNASGTLRAAIGVVDSATDRWVPIRPDARDYSTALDPHSRGAILVAAVFDAFLAIYKRRIENLLLLATHGTGVLASGSAPAALVSRLADEAARAARHLLGMCVRAIDYCPPVDVTFGDFLRAVVTADRDLVPDDNLHYLPVIVEAFRQRGIYPRGVRALSVESLCWKRAGAALDIAGLLRQLQLSFGPGGSREAIAKQSDANSRAVHGWLTGGTFRPVSVAQLGLVLGPDGPGGLYRTADGCPEVRVHSVRQAWRVGPDGNFLTELVIDISQRRRGYSNLEVQDAVDRGHPRDARDPPDFEFYGGCTLLIDPGSQRVRYVIEKSILDTERLDGQRSFLQGETWSK